MKNAIRILSISDDDGLRYSRQLLLVSDGYEAESTNSRTAFAVAARSFDIALLCSSVDPKRALALGEMLRRCNPDIQILLITPTEGASLLETDLEVPSGPESLLHAIKQTCEQKGEPLKRLWETSPRG
jgi:DNA-binding NtrC family response regulator